MPSHPEAVQEIRTAFRQGDFTRAEAERLLRAEGLSATVINATLSRTGGASGLGTAAVSQALGIGQDPVSRGGARAPIVTGAAQQRPARPGEEPFEDPFTRLRRLAEERAAREAEERRRAEEARLAQEAENRRLALEEARRQQAEDLARQQLADSGFAGDGGGDGGGGGGGGGELDLGIAESDLTPLQQLQIEQSATRGGRGTLFDQFRAGQPLQSLLGQRVQQRRFNPLSAIFGLTRAQNPESAQNFATFLQNQAGRSLGGNLGFQGAFQNLGNIFQPGSNEVGPSGATEEERRSAQRQVFEDPSDPNFARNAIIAGFANLFPGLPGAGRRAAGRRIDQFQSGNAEAIPLFQAFLEGLLGQGGGGFFGGFQ